MKIRNILDGSIIEILEFNYDGKGSALYIEGGFTTIQSFTLEEVNDLLLGEVGHELKYEYYTDGH